jgi:hypothetical protein
MNGHLTWQYPNKPPAPGSGNQSRPKGQQNYIYDKVNHVTTEEAQQAQDIVLGMFLASSHPAIVLFDSGASHSFISSTFVATHHLPITIMKHIMLVSSPGGEMRTKHICLAVSITIRGGRLSGESHHPRFQGHRNHLGMDWLRKYDGVIRCAMRAIRLTKEDGTIVEFNAAMEADQASLLNQVQGTSLEEIRVVQEYLDIFLDDLPGLSPDHDIEFIIDLLPGTHPISKRPYRILVNELADLKTQIVEL